MEAKLKKGTYYVGDPCYIFDKSWQEILETTNYLDDDGICKIKGKDVFSGSTAYGDGRYEDNHGRGYDVDAGLIAILPIALLNVDKRLSKKGVETNDGMHIIKMENDFICDVENGVFTFGDIVIDTANEEDEEYCDCCGQSI